MVTSCKEDVPDITIPPEGSCLISSESKLETGGRASWKYEYSSGRLSKIIRLNSSDDIQTTTEISSTIVKITNANGAVEEYVYDADIFTENPSRADVSIITDGVKHSNYYNYLFSYDTEGRLTKINEHTPSISSDGEWNLNITYNEHSNVTQLRYNWTEVTGDITVSLITVSSYDDKLTPYAEISGWKFMMSNYIWYNHDSEPILTALSKNNPLDYTSEPSTIARSMSYSYNDKGFPIFRTTIEKSSNSEYSFAQGMSYQCR